jgi:hypothetical protein
MKIVLISLFAAFFLGGGVLFLWPLRDMFTKPPKKRAPPKRG